MELLSFVRKNAFSDYFTSIKNHKFSQIYAETSFVVGVTSIPLLEFSLSSSSHSLISTGFSLLRASSAFLASIFANLSNMLANVFFSFFLLALIFATQIATLFLAA